jgi:cyclic beta-1,2-glucan synthetase
LTQKEIDAKEVLLMASFSEDITSAHALPLTAPVEDVPSEGLPEEPTVTDVELRRQADLLVKRWQPLPAKASQDQFLPSIRKLQFQIEKNLRIWSAEIRSNELTPRLELVESSRMWEAAVPPIHEAETIFRDLPQAHMESSGDRPRILQLARGYLEAVDGVWSQRSLEVYVQQVQARVPLLLKEIQALPSSLRLAQAEFLLNRAEAVFAGGELPPIERSPFSAPLHSLRRLNHAEWRTVLEPLIAFEEILRQDPTGVYSAMDEITRQDYRLRVARYAEHSISSEVEVAAIALQLAREAASESYVDPRVAKRKAHIGCYLVAEGKELLEQRIRYRAPLIERVRTFVRKRSQEYYILGTFLLSLALITAILLPLVPHHEFWAVMIALLLALLPATQGAVDLVNGIASALMPTEALPKLDFSEGVPADAATLVVVPTLLLNQRQVEELLLNLEARYLSNKDPNIHFALLSDLPDSLTPPPSPDNGPLAEFAHHAIQSLNEKYAGRGGGAFFLLHRHRIFNAPQGVWMGWERKRGKLLDLNKLLLHEYDSFPLKTGPLDVFDKICYVITLDSDTQLPNGTAARLIGTIVHPLNQAIIDPRLRIVTQGYGILQPRVGVSVSSASSSRMAALYSGETGFDIYTRAVSDAYQDLFGEGIFTGKGIYDVSAFHKVLDRRFPRNALLSHDLIEGAYVRVGLVSDIEVIDDYPSHYSAHTRRKHRWLRGDWQITRWLFSPVPDESGRMVVNPISTISRWKILDNLRRSLIEPITFLLFVFGWFFLPGGALYWTATMLLLSLLPGLVQLGFNLSRALLQLSLSGVLAALRTFAASFGLTLLNIIFLPHHMLLALDAIVRSLNRTLISGRNLLDWETAAQSEAGTPAGPLAIYLNLSPAIALAIALLLAFINPHALLAAGPVLLLWVLAPTMVLWLNSPLQRADGPLSRSDEAFLRERALLTWRYFLEFGGIENRWLIPDNVEEQNLLQIRKLSPTNLGMLLNTRQAAHELGFLTLPEFAEATLGTLNTYRKLEKVNGHIYNWYDIESLQPVAPFTVSAVDSGNLAASFYTLHAGALDLLKRPLLRVRTLENLMRMSGLQGAASGQTKGPGDSSIRAAVRRLMDEHPPHGDGLVREEVVRCRKNTIQFIEGYLPWLLPRFDGLLDSEAGEEREIPSLEEAAGYVTELQKRLKDANISSPGVSSILSGACQRLAHLKEEISHIAIEAEQQARAMDYKFLLVESRALLSIGYDGATGKLHSACYDLLASEARIAVFLAVAKGDIHQESWFKLDRSHVLVNGRACLMSWTGTMFEYMMPALWMRLYPNTLIMRSLEAAVRTQREHVRDIPWGISESGFAKTDAAGRYSYQAWGIPELALKYGAEDGPVISPYSTFLALPLLRQEAIANLRRMASLGWTGNYGFYEAADYTEGREPKLVRSWMAHHQGMSLLALTNLLEGDVFQRWFHANPIVHAAELLLHERPLNKEAVKSLAKPNVQEDDSEDIEDEETARRHFNGNGSRIAS